MNDVTILSISANKTRQISISRGLIVSAKILTLAMFIIFLSVIYFLVVIYGKENVSEKKILELSQNMSSIVIEREMINLEKKN